MTKTSLDPVTSDSTFGLQFVYKLSRQPRSIDTLETDLSEYGICTMHYDRPGERHQPPTTQPVSGGVYFAKVAQHPGIECYYFGSHSDFGPRAVNHSGGIKSSLRDVTAILCFAAANARATGETSRPLIRPERNTGGGRGRPDRTWIAQKENDISEVIRTLQGIHQRSVLADLMQRASQLGALKTGWNSYSDPPPATVAIGNAKTILTLASVAGIIPERIEPSAMGGVGLTFIAGSREVTVEFYNVGSAHALFSDKHEETLDTAPVAPGVEGYNRFLQEVRRYLYGHNEAAHASRSKLPRR